MTLQKSTLAFGASSIRLVKETTGSTRMVGLSARQIRREVQRIERKQEKARRKL